MTNYRGQRRIETPTIPIPIVRSIVKSIAHPPNVGTGTLTTGTATGAKKAETVHAAAIAPVTNGLVVVVAPPQPLMLVNVKPVFAVAVHVVVLPKLTGFGAQLTTPPLAETATVATGTVLSTKFAVTVQALVIVPVVNVLVDEPTPPHPLMPPLAAGLMALPPPAANAEATKGAIT